MAATDLSPGMRPTVVADAVRLPYADGAFDAGLAMHMLYHACDIPAAISRAAPRGAARRRRAW